MLQELRVENLLLIEKAQLRLADGLNVLTGETGAGKTVLAHALDLLLGGRARPSIVRPGAAEAYVEGIFDAGEEARRDLGERMPADAQEIVLARRVGADGRTRAYLNGRSITVGELREIGGRLLVFYGQHEHRKLTLGEAQLQILDGLAGDAQHALLAACAEAYAEGGRLARRLDELREVAGARERELDLLAFELAEIEAADPRENEHEQLLAARGQLRSAGALSAAAGSAAESLSPDGAQTPGASELLAQALGALDAVDGVDPRLDALAVRLRSALLEARDLAGELRSYGERAGSLELDGALAELGEEVSLDIVEERLQRIERLMRKHGGSVAEVREYAAGARARIAELEGADAAIAQTERELARTHGRLGEQSRGLTEARLKAARALERGVREQLNALAMPEAGFEVVIAEREPGPAGGDSVEFMIAPNRGVPAGPLREIASGGELSRIMLAIMSVARGRSGEATLVFDEVDAGIGGHTARAVGARLRELAEHAQVLCITHLPQIASLGDRHFSIAKDARAEPARTTVLELGEREVVSELVRMLGADADDVGALRHARELRRAA